MIDVVDLAGLPVGSKDMFVLIIASTGCERTPEGVKKPQIIIGELAAPEAVA